MPEAHSESHLLDLGVRPESDASLRHGPQEGRGEPSVEREESRRPNRVRDAADDARKLGLLSRRELVLCHQRHPRKTLIVTAENFTTAQYPSPVSTRHARAA